MSITGSNLLRKPDYEKTQKYIWIRRYVTFCTDVNNAEENLWPSLYNNNDS
jgi:hypothetical protein